MATIEQGRVIATGQEVRFPTGEVVDVLGVPTIFLVGAGDQFSFHQVELDSTAFQRLIPHAMISQGVEYKQALVVGRNGVAILAICAGEDRSDYLDNNRPIATVFNLNDEPDGDLVLSNGQPLANNKLPSGGLEISEWEQLLISASENGVIIELSPILLSENYGV